MADPAKIYELGDFYVPRFEVKINGASQSKEVVRDITQVSYKDQIGEIDTFELTVNNWDADARAFKHSDSRTFDPGQEIELWMGYHGKGPFRRMLTGQITGLRPTFPAGGHPTLAVTGLNILHQFRKEQESHTYLAKTDSEIAREVGRRLKVQVDTKPGVSEPRHRYLAQQNEFDIVFLLNRARERGYEVVVVEDPKGGKPRIYFGPSDQLARATYELYYGRSLIQFQPNLTTANQVAEVTVRGWDPLDKRPIEVTVKRSQLPNAGKRDRAEGTQKAFNERREVVTEPPVSTREEAREQALSLLSENAKDLVKGSGAAIGLPDLRAGGSLLLRGLGERFSGRYFVTSSSHGIGTGGYTTQFDCRLEELDPEGRQ